jgi:alkanesulfonate monooxygenase SsuD/methylene tetrahydromethanopterin reductase-like flavin-dependent oxidoreductase (luciferase family)
MVAALGAGWNETEFAAFGLPFDHHVSRFAEAFEIVRRLLAGERVTFHGRYHTVEDAVLLPPPARTPRLMIGANQPRMLSLTLPHVDAWNTWYARYGNTVEGFAAHNAEVSEAAERAGRDPSEIERSACVYVEVAATGERPRDVEPVPAASLPQHLAGLADAGADEAILVLEPITEDAVRNLPL